MSIQAKREAVLRVGGMILIFFTLAFSIILAFYNLGNWFLYMGLLTVILPYFSFILCLKLEISLIVKNKAKILIIIAAVSFLLLVFFVITSSATSAILMYVFLIVKDILILVCWQFSLSIYKNEKILYGIGGIGTILVFSIICVYSYLFQTLWYLNLLVLALFSTGFLLILITERIMINKGLLKYI